MSTKIERMEAEIERLNELVAELRARIENDPEGSNTFAEPYDDSPKPLGRDVRVRFGGMEASGCTFDVHMVGGDLEVRANGTHMETALIPYSSNNIRIRMVDR
jgi:hypothetical protein